MSRLEAVLSLMVNYHHVTILLPLFCPHFAHTIHDVNINQSANKYNIVFITWSEFHIHIILKAQGDYYIFFMNI